jgi:uncharacterized membrane-anchored protein YhcB (DUF1043 family)
MGDKMFVTVGSCSCGTDVNVYETMEDAERALAKYVLEVLRGDYVDHFGDYAPKFLEALEKKDYQKLYELHSDWAESGYDEDPYTFEIFSTNSVKKVSGEKLREMLEEYKRGC